MVETRRHASQQQQQQQRAVFVTVGTTKFEALVRAVDARAFADALADAGYTRLVIQKGAGEYEPRVLVPPGQRAGTVRAGAGGGVDLTVEWFDFSPSLAGHVAAAALVVSHAGAGSVFEALSAGRPLIVVPNPLLMDNHQAELGGHLAAMRALACASPDGLADAVRRFDAAALRPFPRASGCGIAERIDAFMGRRAGLQEGGAAGAAAGDDAAAADEGRAR